MKPFFKHILAIILFVIVSLVYFNPVLSGKAIFQNDIKQYIGMSKQQKDYFQEEGKETYWTNSAFGGMPTFQLGAKFANNYIKKIDASIRFLPRPADYLFIYLIGFYILLLTLKIDFKLALLGAFAFGFSTYLIIILGVGHNAKAHAIAYMPVVISGVFMVFNKKYISGLLLTTLGAALELVANHYQMTYYLFLLIGIIYLFFLVDKIRDKSYHHILKSTCILVFSAFLAIGMNATSILSTKEYSLESTRGKSDLTINFDSSPKLNTTGLDKSYITEYSYGIFETFNLFIPRLFGGGSYEDVGKASNSYNFFVKMGLSPIEALNQSKQIPTYWGDQPIVEAPAYIGAIIIFCFVLALFIYKGKHKKWLVFGIVFSLLLSFGKNLDFVTNFFIDYVPFYNKFRAVSSIQVIVELCIPLIAVLGLASFFENKDKAFLKNKLLYSFIITAGLCLVFLLFRDTFFDFVGQSDGYYIQTVGQEFINAVRLDRKAFFNDDVTRTLILVCFTALILFLFIKEKVNKTMTISLLILLLIIDLVGVDRRYVNNENFINARNVEIPFVPNTADKDILSDSTHFRVHDLTSSGARASYFHNSVGGYHAAKLSRFNDIIDFYINKNNLNVLNMLNVKYIILNNEAGEIQTYFNEEANGNAWFISNLIKLESADKEIIALDSLSNKTTAVTTDINLMNSSFKVLPDSEINLVAFKSDYLKYNTSNINDGFAVLSEVYYPHGWEVYIDGKLTALHRVDYLLRGLFVPEGEHIIELKFNPQIVQTGQTISLWSFIVFILLVVFGLLFKFKKVKTSA